MKVSWEKQILVSSKMESSTEKVIRETLFMVYISVIFSLYRMALLTSEG